jgi:CheY-like chemotaxis protein
MTAAERENIVYIVDDDPVFRFATSKTITLCYPQLQIKTFVDGLQIIEHLKVLEDSDLPGYIFLDINMPQMNGWQFLESYKSLRKMEQSGTRIFMLSSSIDPSDIERSNFNPLVEKYLVKPLSPEMIFSIFQERRVKD